MTDTIDPQYQDAEAVKAVLGGATDRYEEIVRRHERQIFAIAWSRLGNASLAEEAAQQAFVRGYLQLSQLKDGAKVGAWIGTMARNIAINLSLMHRREMDKRERWSMEQVATTRDEDVESGEDCNPKVLQEAMAELPTLSRECLVLFYLKGNSSAEAAGALGISEATFRVKLHRARASLRKEMDRKLARSLHELRPGNSFLGAVMAGIFAAVPSTNAAGIGGAVAGGGYAASKVATGSVWGAGKALLSLGGILPWALFDWWIERREAANFTDPEGFRSKLYRLESSSRITSFIIIGLALWYGKWIEGVLHRAVEKAEYLFKIGHLFDSSKAVGSQPLCFVIFVFSSFYTFLMLRTYRNGPNRLFAIHCVAGVLMTVFSFLAGIGQVPFMLAGILFPAVSLLWTYSLRYRPMKMDYNLFLRASQGMLKPSAADAGESPAPVITEGALVRFSRFLGSRFLVIKQKRMPDGLRLFLMPVRKRFVRDLFAWIPSIKESYSYIQLHPDGTVTAMCGEADARDIAALNQDKLPEIEVWEAKVTSALQTSLRLVCEGKNTLAEDILGEVAELEILKKPVSKAPIARWLWFMELFDFAFILLFFSAIGLFLWWFRK
ncbi:MAG: sigma-70 family RNA polymerase sigma factor [Verrucomicrobiota bacterium]